MSGQMMMWVVYFDNFLENPISLKVLIGSMTISAIFYLLFKKTPSAKRKINYLALHIMTLFFPFIFSAAFWKCMMPVATCSPKLFIFLAPILLIAAVVASFTLLPYIYSWSGRNNQIKQCHIKEFVAKESEALGIKEPNIYSINEIKPVAYSITSLKPAIFVSAGLAEILSGKELESVLLHELYHHKSKAYFWKFSLRMLGIFTPLSTFTNTKNHIKREEIKADNYAALVQETKRYLNSAKRKIVVYGYFCMAT